MAGITLNTSGDCGSAISGTGKSNCDLNSLGQLKGGAFLNKGTKIPISTFSKQTIVNAIKDRKMHQLLEFNDFKQNNTKNGVATSGLGVKTQTSQGQPELELDFTQGTCFHKAIYSLAGQDRWDLVLYFLKGVLFFSSEDGLSVKGADAGMVSVESLEFQNGNNSQKSKVDIQLKDVEEFNTRFVFKTWEELGFNMFKLPGVIDCDVDVITTTLVGATTIDIVVKTKCSGTQLSVFDTASNWVLGGVQATPTTVTAVAYNVATGIFTLTLSNALSTGDTLQPTLSDGTYLVAQDVMEQLYAGKSNLLTV